MGRKRGFTLLVVAFVALVITAPALAAGRTPQAAARAGAGMTTYVYTGTEQIYRVPAGTTAVTITAAGAVGGADWRNAKPGGGRAVVTATVPVPVGTTLLYVVVGGPGSTPVSDQSGAPGGFNGGGASVMSWGGSGGGASDVRTQPLSVALTDTDSRLVVAGGGGGAGSGEGSGGNPGWAGLAAVTGAGAGGDGSDVSATGASAGHGGFGGTTGGMAGALAPSSTGYAAEAGQLGQGGAGSAGRIIDFFSVYVTFAGGGGGGYFGGGGGGDGTYGGGGGAGSSYWVDAAVDTSMTQSVGDAYVSISPPSAASAKPVVSRLSPTAGKRGIVVTVTGKSFGARRGTSFVKFGKVKCGSYVSWSSTRIKCRVPAKAAFGRAYVKVTTAGGVSNAKTFTVKR